MKLMLAVCVLVVAANAAQQTFTELLDAVHKNPAFNQLPQSEQFIIVELLAEARLGELQAYIDKVGFARVLSAIDHLPEREAHIITEALIKELNMENSQTSTAPTAVGKRSLQDVIATIERSPSYANLTAAEQQTIKEIARAAESNTLTAYINKVGYATVLQLLDDSSVSKRPSGRSPGAQRPTHSRHTSTKSDTLPSPSSYIDASADGGLFNRGLEDLSSNLE